MKYIYIAIVILATSFFVGCKEYEDDVTPGNQAPDGCLGVYFPSSNKANFELMPTDETQITLTIARTDSTGVFEAPLTVEINDSSVFVVPETVSFADGQKEVEFIVTFPTAGEGIAYTLKVAFTDADNINPYGVGIPYVETSVIRIQWVEVEDPMVYVDGTFAAYWAVDTKPMYVHAEKAMLGGVVRYRFKNAYQVSYPGDWNSDQSDWIPVPDADGIYNGYYYNWPGDFDDTKDWYTTIEVESEDGLSGDAYMFPHDIGAAWSYGMISIGTYTASDGTLIYGTVKDGVITFPEDALFYGQVDKGLYLAGNPTYIYFTKEAYIAANKKIKDFNDIALEEVVGEVGVYSSAALNNSWDQTLYSAVDIDAENEDSEYKNLFYLSDVYASGSGLGIAFYYNEATGKIKIPASQATGLNFLTSDVYVSQSDSLESVMVVGANGVNTYTLGLTFHFEDGTIVGDFEEKFYYAEVTPTVSKDNFIGDFVMSGSSLFADTPDVSYDVTIEEGTGDSLVITGLKYAAEVIAVYDAANSVITIASQTLADLEPGTDANLVTFDGTVSGNGIIVLECNVIGNLLISGASQASGYLINSDAVGGWIESANNLVFTLSTGKSANVKVDGPVIARSIADVDVVETTKNVGNNFKIQGKISHKTEKKYVTNSVVY